MKMRKKQGVTMITLSLAVAIMAILTAAVIVNIDNIVPNARKSKIAEEFELIEDRVKEYYLTYGNYPVLNNITYTKAQLTSLNTTGKGGALTASITANGDDEAIFFVVDLEKVRVTTYNYGKNITQDDIYVVSDLTGNLYYPKGVSANGEIVFSTCDFEDTTNID